MQNKKSNITLKAKTNLDEVKEQIKRVEKHLEEASAIIEQLASEGISVEFEVER